MRIHLSLADPTREEWVNLGATEGCAQESFGTTLHRYMSELHLPGGEHALMRGVYDPRHRIVSISIHVEDKQVFELSGRKSADDGHDPSGSFRTPKGNYVQVLFGP